MTTTSTQKTQDTTRKKTRPGRGRRLLAATILVVATFALLWPWRAPMTAMEDSGASAAVQALVHEDAKTAAAAVPSDFADVLGYQPVIVDDELVRLDGDCSSPVPLPQVFEPACQQHDLGYDLLRYAEAKGSPLGGWARVGLDDRMADRMLASCADAAAPVGCGEVARVAHSAVRLNSIRQFNGAPLEDWASLTLTSVAAGGLLWLVPARSTRDRGTSRGAVPVGAGAEPQPGRQRADDRTQRPGRDVPVPSVS